MKKLWLRLKSETPPFFKNMQKLGGALIALDYAILHIQVTAANLPTWFITLGGNIAMIGTTILVVSQFAVTNINLLEGKDDKTVDSIIDTPTTGGNIAQTITPTN